MPFAVNALVLGATPENGYELEHDAVAFKVEKVTGWEETRFGVAPATAPALQEPDISPTVVLVHFAVAGTLPGHSRTRHVRMELFEGRWRVREFASLAQAVELPPAIDDEDAEAERRAEAEIEAYQIVRRGEQEALASGPVNLNRLAAKKAKSAALAASRAAHARKERHERAVASTSEQARRLSGCELNRKFAAEPAFRRIVHIKDGHISANRILKPGELFDPSLGFEAEILTVEELAAAETQENASQEQAFRAARTASG